MRVRKYEPTDQDMWDRLVASSWNGTFLHTRRFLSYHGDRFEDASLLVVDDRDRLLGVLPAALDPSRPDAIHSHPGLTYGGVVHDGRLRGSAMVDALAAAVESYRAAGLTSLRYKVVPPMFHRVPSADDQFALFQLGAVRSRCDLAAVIDLDGRPPLNQRRTRSRRKAIEHGVRVERGPAYLEPLWTVLSERLLEKYGGRPVHSLAEITALVELFPEQIECVVGLVDHQVVAGVVLFRACRVVRSQYIAANATGYEVCALDLVFDEEIRRAAEHGARYFCFGTSAAADGQTLNDDLHRFKTEFGGGGTVYETYELTIGDR
jgi:hypothetical protein